MRTGGVGATFAANLAWLAAYLGTLPLRLVKRREDAVPEDFARTLRHSFWPSARDYRASVPQWDEPPGRPPAWMAT
jgi:hypothetical protein